MAVYKGTSSDNLIIGSADIDYIFGGNGNDTLYGRNGNDNLFGEQGNDILWGEAGDDVLNGGDGNDLLYGGDGNDTASYNTASKSGVWVNLSINTSQNTLGAGYDLLVGIENLLGSNYNDNLTGNSDSNTLDGNQGNDVLNGGAGDDYLIGGAGNDYLNGGIGIDTAIFENNFNSSVNVNLAKSIATGKGLGTDTLISIENVVGTKLADVLIGNNLANVLDGRDGNDDLQGGAGDDVLIGGKGDDQLQGGTGIDTASYANALSNSTYGVQVNLAEGKAIALGNNDSGNDKLSGIENIIGSNYNDKLIGDSNNNVLNGGSGDDYFEGGAGQDKIYCGAGNDYVKYDSINDAKDFIDGGKAPLSAKFIKNDVIDASASKSGVFMEFSNKIINFDQAIGTHFNDIFINMYSGLKIDGLDGADTYFCNLKSAPLKNVEISHFSLDDYLVLFLPSNYSITTSLYTANHQNGTLLTIPFLNGTNHTTETSTIFLKGLDINKFSMDNVKIYTNNFDSIITGSSVSEILNGTDKNDILISGQGSDIVKGGLGKDYFFYLNDMDNLDRMEGSNTYISGKIEKDTLDASLSRSGVHLNFGSDLGIKDIGNYIASLYDDTFENIHQNGLSFNGNGGHDTYQFASVTNEIKIEIKDFTPASRANANTEKDFLSFDIDPKSKYYIDAFSVVSNDVLQTKFNVYIDGVSKINLTLIGVDYNELSKSDFGINVIS